MATAILDIDVERIPTEVAGLSAYGQALVLLRLRGRPVAYLATLRRLTRGVLVRAFAAAGVTALTFYDDDRPRETLGRLRVLTGAYYRLSGVAPYLEVVARKT